ncbi:SubName: Full=Uncharacterized protein {ECO:0000313/EMBL:CCA70727.1} [Serendipita indica DSM 11827]|nr:SubName: Full=Uncharacterized protein {ECO:0000313/EMBL:CCA70727.1} [Serendipita indica DSM 11827]
MKLSPILGFVFFSALDALAQGGDGLAGTVVPTSTIQPSTRSLLDTAVGTAVPVASSGDNQNSDGDKKVIIALSILVSFLGLLVLVGAFFIYKRYKARRAAAAVPNNQSAWVNRPEGWARDDGDAETVVAPPQQAWEAPLIDEKKKVGK